MSEPDKKWSSDYDDVVIALLDAALIALVAANVLVVISIFAGGNP